MNRLNVSKRTPGRTAWVGRRGELFGVFRYIGPAGGSCCGSSTHHVECSECGARTIKTRDSLNEKKKHGLRARENGRKLKCESCGKPRITICTIEACGDECSVAAKVCMPMQRHTTDSVILPAGKRYTIVAIPG